MNIIFLVIVILAGALYIYYFAGSNREAEDTSRPSSNKMPSIQKNNDKIILVKNVKHEEITIALTRLCNLYNKDDFAAMTRLWQLSDNDYVITFPYDVDFAIFCFAVNFLKYPIKIKWNADVKAWATTKPGDNWITEKSVNKKVMLFLTDDDKEYDNVFLTTEDGIGYKLRFFMNKEGQLLPNPKENYIAPGITFEELGRGKFEDFK